MDAVAESVREERADAGRDGQTVSRASMDRGKKNVFLSVQLAHKQHWQQPSRLIPILL